MGSPITAVTISLCSAFRRRRIKIRGRVIVLRLKRPSLVEQIARALQIKRYYVRDVKVKITFEKIEILTVLRALDLKAKYRNLISSVSH